MHGDSDLLRQAIEARDRAERHGLPDTARALAGIARMIAAVEAEARFPPAPDATDRSPASAAPPRPA